MSTLRYISLLVELMKMIDS